MQIVFDNETTLQIGRLESALAMLKQHGSRVKLQIDGQAGYGAQRIAFVHVEDEPAADPLRLAAEIAGDALPIPPLEARP